MNSENIVTDNSKALAAALYEIERLKSDNDALGRLCACLGLAVIKANRRELYLHKAESEFSLMSDSAAALIERFESEFSDDVAASEAQLK